MNRFKFTKEERIIPDNSPALPTTAQSRSYCWCKLYSPKIIAGKIQWVRQ